jgi:hypothetical protein
VRSRRSILLSFFLLVIATSELCADVILSKGDNFAIDVSSVDGRIAMDLLGSIWILPAGGGQAELATDGLLPAARPRWSPDGKQILYQTASADGISLWILNVATKTSRRISAAELHNQLASWHPDGSRIIYASGRNNDGFDIWETDLPSGLSWRISNHRGDELGPTWSGNGRDLAYIKKRDEKYFLILRRHGQPETELLVSDQPLSSLSWRPDGTLLTFVRDSGDELSQQMIILSEPPLVRQFAEGEDVFAFPVSWQDRSRHLYTADGAIKTRAFGDQRSRPLPFRATVRSREARAPLSVAQHVLAVSTPPTGPLVIRGARLFDGIWRGYRERMDVLIDGGKIVAVETQREWDDATILDLGDVTILPGLIDSWSAMPSGSQQRNGPRLLAHGVTTIVSDEVDPAFDFSLWDREDTPGPRILPAIDINAGQASATERDYYLAKISASDLQPEAEYDAVRAAALIWRERGVPVVAENWNMRIRVGADLLIGAASLPNSSLVGSYQDLQNATTLEPVTLISGLADAGTPGIQALFSSRQAIELHQEYAPRRRLLSVPQLATVSSSIIVGSKPNGMPPGLALHAELRALAASGLSGEQVLHAAGRNAAIILGLENQIGTITPGALADLILVSGDPLNKVSDTLNIVAVIRNGRFFSLINLLERAAVVTNVE